jgi:hypothetical protein
MIEGCLEELGEKLVHGVSHHLKGRGLLLLSRTGELPVERATIVPNLSNELCMSFTNGGQEAPQGLMDLNPTGIVLLSACPLVPPNY